MRPSNSLRKCQSLPRIDPSGIHNDEKCLRCWQNHAPNKPGIIVRQNRYRGRYSSNRNRRGAYVFGSYRACRRFVRYSSAPYRRNTDSTEEFDNEQDIYESLYTEQIPIRDLRLTVRASSQSFATSSLQTICLNNNSSSRDDFFRNFQVLLANNSLAKSSRFKECLSSTRKHSHQVILVGSGTHKYKLSDIIWLQLQAVLAGRRMGSIKEQLQSTRDHDKYIAFCRESQKVILDDIRIFTLSEDILNFNKLHLSDTLSEGAMKASLKSVKSLLEKYENFVMLFPDMASMTKIVQIDQKVVDRISLLYMWYNLVLTLYSSIRQVGDILGVTKEYRSSSCVSTFLSSSGSPEIVSSPPSTVSWPNLDVEQGDDENLDDDTGLKLDDIAIRNSLSTDSGDNLQGTVLSQSLNRSTTLSDLPVLLEQPPSLFASFVSKSLRLKGMRRVLKRLDDVSSKILAKTITFLKKPPGSYVEAVTKSGRFSGKCVKNADTEHCRVTIHNKEFISMRLPSFAGVFLFLARVPLELAQEWLKMRGSAELSSDILTLQTIMEDCRDCLETAIDVKQKYLDHVQSAGLCDSDVLKSLSLFEDYLGKVFKYYLKCVRDWALIEMRMEGCGVECSENIIQCLRTEWGIAKRFAFNVICGESEVAYRFCVIGSDLLKKMVQDFLLEKELLLDECKSEFDTSNLKDIDFNAEILSRGVSSPIFVACRPFKALVGQLRDRSLRAMSFIRCLLMDLEICCTFKFKSYANISDIMAHFSNTSHSMVCVQELQHKYLILCDKNAAKNISYVEALLDITCSRKQTDLLQLNEKQAGYLLFIPLVLFEDFSEDSWEGAKLIITPDADTHMSLGYLQVVGDICLVALNSSSLFVVRDHFMKSFANSTNCPIELLEEQCSSHEIIVDHIERLKEDAKEACCMFWTKLAGGMAEEILDGRTIESLDSNEIHSLRATLQQSYNLAFEFYRELFRILPRSSRKWLAENTLTWAKQWKSFIVKMVDPGDGSIPLWATQSLNFLLQASDPQISFYLSDCEYQELTCCIKTCVEHIMGSGPKDLNVANGSHADENVSENHSIRSRSSLDHKRKLADKEFRSKRLLEALSNIDRCREKRLMDENRIGRIHIEGREITFLSYFGPKKRAPFEWQRLEKKIGSGKYGTVYVVMNLTDHCLMAMKQIRIERSHKILHCLVDEVETLRSLDHPNLVKYYAVEAHREELMIFMEYCSEGTLESIIREGLLDMRCVRRYTHFLLQAVEYIHSRKIIHRDIKPANIFLGKKNVLKLGDFGSSVRLRAKITTRGEIAEWVGTPAYMAPEVQTLGGRVEVGGKMENLGYGRAADIWSVGCVVLEMCTGKPPWSECEHVMQIVFRVGSGMKPQVPPNVQSDADCFSFLECCFVTDPNERATSEQLRQHPFANIAVRETVDARKDVTFR